MRPRLKKSTNTEAPPSAVDCGSAASSTPPPEIAATLSVLSGKWKVLIIWTLYRGTSRFNALKRGISGITQYTLTAQLRELEAEGIVSRQIFAEVPLRVEYSLTSHGKTLGPVLRTLAAWGRTHVSSSSAIRAADAKKAKAR
jgi:DNA-binding HxlR family transcriptional regulator